jgi:hypothetical protein
MRSGCFSSSTQEELSHGGRVMKTFETKYGLFILNGSELTLSGSGKFITIENPDTLNDERLERIYKVIWDDGFDNNSPIDKLGVMAHGLSALYPKSF